VQSRPKRVAQSGKFCIVLDFPSEASFTCGGLAPMPAGAGGIVQWRSEAERRLLKEGVVLLWGTSSQTYQL